MASARTAAGLIRAALDEGKLALSDVEMRWLGRIEQGLAEPPESEGALYRAHDPDRRPTV